MLKPEYLLILFSFSVLTFVVGLIFSRRNYFVRFKSNYSFRNMFPFEFNFRGSFADNMLGNAFLIVSFVSMIIFYSTFEEARSEAFGLFTFVGGCLASLMVCALFFVSTRALKTHILLVALSYATIFLIIATTALLNLKYYQFYKDAVSLTGFIYSIVLGILTFALAMNPKLSFRINAQKVEGQEEKMERPKWIPIAFTEWAMIIILHLNEIGVLIFCFATYAKYL